MATSYPVQSRVGETLTLLVNILRVGAGQVVCCCILGVGLVWAIEKHPRVLRLFKTGIQG